MDRNTTAEDEEVWDIVSVARTGSISVTRPLLDRRNSSPVGLPLFHDENDPNKIVSPSSASLTRRMPFGTSS